MGESKNMATERDNGYNAPLPGQDKQNLGTTWKLKIYKGA